MGCYEEYKDLLSKSYYEAIEHLLLKYSAAKDDYFREKSYQRFMEGKIKNITKGNFSRTSDGLYCHHIDEIKMLKISDQRFVKRNKIPFKYQKKDKLVYCDLIEHTILHALITKETTHEFGYPGYALFLKPLIEEWFVEERIPSMEWMKNCHKKAFLSPQEAVEILKVMEEMLGRNYYSTALEYHEAKQKQEDMQRMMATRLNEEERNKWIEKAKLLHSKSTRKEIVDSIYHLKFKDRTYEPFVSGMKKYTKDRILEELTIYLKGLSEHKDKPTVD
ncbi:hypothetical protein GCM10008931_42570 [Oceanobacillus oncorhynchi subsp. oncorhynchi]|uniref:hypothetical protein n=1 Tax=Oceanobacillus oncorhynchi TaxID=545501 RepID=UPI0031E03B41